LDRIEHTLILYQTASYGVAVGVAEDVGEADGTVVGAVDGFGVAPFLSPITTTTSKVDEEEVLLVTV
jgi:hypothetical protein